MIDGVQIVRECGLGWHAGAPGLARRIDAALAESEHMRVHWKTVADGLEANNIGLMRMLADERAKLAECEAQSTADAAARCIERARQEGAEEMRARCAQVVDAAIARGSGILDDIAAAIRSLDAGALAARRG